MPVAVALSSAPARVDRRRSGPQGSPRKIVSPAIAPSTRICPCDSGRPFAVRCKACLTRRPHYSDSRSGTSTGRRTSWRTGKGIRSTSTSRRSTSSRSRSASTGPRRRRTRSPRASPRCSASPARRPGEMLKRLEADGLVERGEHKEAILTPTGIERAERVVRKHRLIERFLTDFMGYTAAESHVHADELGDTFSDDMVERINERLGHPDRCPHGWPIEPDVEQAENAELVSLAELRPGGDGRDRAARRARRRSPALVLRQRLRARRDGAARRLRDGAARSPSSSTARRARSTRSSRRACTCGRRA